MSGIAEVQARMATIGARIEGLATRRAQVDPLALAAFTAQLASASAASATSPTAAGGPGVLAPPVRAGADGVAVAAPVGPRPAWASTGVDLAGVFADATARYGLPEGLLQAVAQRESGMRVDAVSPAGARGLMQLMPGTARELRVDPMDPVQAVDGAARYLRRQLDTFGSLELALAAYNAGPGAVRRHDGIPPYAETRAYVTAVLSALQEGRSA